MNNRYYKILNIIKNSYQMLDFDSEIFEFYDRRTEKNKYTTGIIKYDNKKYYYKIVSEDSYIANESYIKEMIKPGFTIINKIDELRLDNGEIINLYKYIPATEINTFNYLRNSNIKFIEKEKKMKEFFYKKFKLMRKNYNIEKMCGSKKSDRWFWGRMKENERKERYYGKDFKDLYIDILQNCPSVYTNIKNFLDNILDYLERENLTITTYSHGDFHDFNFSLEGIFWDIDTFDFNPILNDFVIFYWHFYAREDNLIYKYCPWLVKYMKNELIEEELLKIRKLKEKFILEWYDEIEKIFKKYEIEDNINSEFVFKIFCRIFLINNVLEYEKEDKIKTYKIFNYFLENNNKQIKKLLFSCNIKF